MKLKRTCALILLLMMVFSAAAGEGTETVTFRRNFTVSKDAEYIDLGNIGVQDNEWEKFYDFLSQLPNLKKVDMFNTFINVKVFKRLNQQFPDIDFGVSIRYGRHRVRTDVTAFSTLYLGPDPDKGRVGDKKHSYDEIAMLSWCRNLYALDIGHHPVKKLDFLYDLPELRVLVVALCNLTDITPIASLKHLEYLEIFHNDITDVSCLKDLKYLMDLDMVQNNVQDLSPLAEIKSLKRLWIYRNIKSDLNSPDEETVRMLQEALPDCHIAARDTSRSKDWVNHPHQEAIYEMWSTRTYKPFDDSLPENMPEPWRTEALKKLEEEQASAETPEAEQE